jgi:hypothetical protein
MTVLVEVCQQEARFELAADLFLQAVAELDAVVGGLEFFVEGGVLEGIKGQLVRQPERGRFGIVHQEIEAVVHARQEDAAGLQDPKTFVPNGLNFLHITVGYGVEDEVELPGRQGEGFGHVRLNHGDGVAFPLGHGFFAGKLAAGIIQYRSDRAPGGKDRHLLAAPGGQAQDFFSRQRGEP